MSVAVSPPSLTIRIATVFLPFAGGYFLSYLFRSVNAVIAPQLVDDLGLGAGDLGLLTAAYFFAFAAFQLPLGLLLDRFGARRVHASLLLVAAAGAWVFAIADGLAMAILGRALIGMGVSGGLMAAFKAITQWFARDRWPLVNGCFLAMGGLGAVSATAPVEAVLAITDWRGLFVGLAAATFGASVLIVSVVPETTPRLPVSSPLSAQLADIGAIVRHVAFLRVAPVVVASTATALAVQGLWAGPWLRDVAGLERAQVAGVLLAMNAALTFGFVSTGLLADRLRRHGVGLLHILGTGVALSALVQLAIILEVDRTGPVTWMLFALLSGTAALSYPYLCGQFPLSHSGRVNTALNLLAFGAAFAVQYAIGFIIDLFPRAADGAFAPAGYRTAFAVFLFAQVCGLAWFFAYGRRTTG